MLKSNIIMVFVLSLKIKTMLRFKYSRLTGDLKLLQLKAAHGWTDKSFKVLLLLLKDMLPEGNLLPDTVYEAKQIVCPMGLKIEKNSCILE